MAFYLLELEKELFRLEDKIWMSVARYALSAVTNVLKSPDFSGQAALYKTFILKGVSPVHLSDMV